MKLKYISFVALMAVFMSCDTTKKATKTVVKEVTGDEKIGEDLDRSVRPKAGKAKELTIGGYEEFVLENGLKVFVIENHKLPTITYSLSIDVDPIFEGEKAGYTSLVGGMLEAGTLTRTKEKLDEEVDFMGASIGAYASGAYASGLSKYKGEMMEILSDVILNPVFPQKEFDKLVKQTLTSLEAESENPDAITRNIKGQVFYGKQHPYGEFMRKETVKRIEMNDVIKYYENNFKANSSVLTIVGDITLAEAKELTKKNLAKWGKGELKKNEIDIPDLPSTPQVAVVNKDGAVQSNIAVGNIVSLKLGDPDYEAVQVMNEIFGGGFSGRLFQNLREDKEYTYGAYGSVNADKYIGSFSASAKTRNEVTDSAVEQFLYEINRIRKEKVSEEDLKSTKQYIAGTFAQALESPRTLASFASNIDEYGLPKDYFKGYLKRINAVTADDVKRVANKYMKPDNIHIVVVGNAAEVGPKLERFGNVMYYDKGGFRTRAPKPMEELSSDITAEKVLNNYIKAIGGEDKLRGLKSIETTMSGSLQGMSLTLEQKQLAPNKSNFKMKMGEMVMMEQTFDGKKGKIVAQGQTQEVSKEDLEDMKIERYFIPELVYAEKGVKTTLKGLKDIKGKKAYEIEVEMPSGAKSLVYFDKTTSYKIRETNTEEGPTGPMTLSTDYSEYKEYSGVKFPSRISMPLGPGMNMDATVKSVKINEKIDPSVFMLK